MWLQPWLCSDDNDWLAHYAPRSIIHPQEPVLILRREHGQNRLAHVLWGLLPGWVKDPCQGPRPINARAETLAEKASFRGAWRHHRCLLPSSGFYEKGHFIHHKSGDMFWMAGLWDRWIGADGSEVDSCCVITTQANAFIQPLHNRMPVIIPDGLEDAWLEPGDQAHRQALQPLLEPSALESWQCTPAEKHSSQTPFQQMSLL